MACWRFLCCYLHYSFQNCRLFEDVRCLWDGLFHLSASRQYHLKLVTQILFQLNLEYFQERKLHSLFGQPMPLFDFSQSKRITSFDVLVMLLMQPRRQLVSFATLGTLVAHGQLVVHQLCEWFSAKVLSNQPDQACTGAGISSITVYDLEQCEENWIKHLIVWHLEEQNAQNIFLAKDNTLDAVSGAVYRRIISCILLTSLLTQPSTWPSLLTFL